MDVSLVTFIGCSPEEDNSTISTKSPKVSKDKLKSDSDMKYPHNKKSYNQKWETDPLLKTWIARHPVDDGKVVCQFCQSVIRAHKNDLLEHTRTLKHQRNFMANSTPQDYNEFVIALNELRKDAQVMNKKRSGKTSNNTSNGGSNTILALPPSLSSSASLNNNNSSCSISNNSNNCSIISTNNSLSSSSNNNNNIMQLNSWTSITTSGILLNNNNCKMNITSNDNNNEEGEEEEEQDDDDDDELSNRNDVDLCWSENNITANSPSDLVSVILEEQEQIGSPNDNSNSDCSVSLTIPTLTPININHSSSSISTPLHHHHIQQQQQQHHQQQQHTVQQTRLLKPDSSSLLLSSVDVISAIQDNYFDLSELIEISRSAIDKIGQLVNGNSMSDPPSLIINNPSDIQNSQEQQIINSQARMDKTSKRKAKRKSDKDFKKMKSMKTENLNFALGLESL